MRNVRAPRRTRAVQSKYDHLHALIHQLIESISQLKELTMASNSELQQSLTDLGAQLDKAHSEIVAKVAALEAAIAAGSGTTPEVDAALEALKGKVQTLDDLHPDSP